MLRTLAYAVVGLLASAGGLRAEDVQGKVKKVDADKGVLTVTIDGKDREFRITDDTKMVDAEGKDLKNRLKSKRLEVGQEVTVTCEKKDGKEVCTRVKLTPKKKDSKGG
jgi:hypothetical protein